MKPNATSDGQTLRIWSSNQISYKPRS